MLATITSKQTKKGLAIWDAAGAFLPAGTITGIITETGNSDVVIAKITHVMPSDASVVPSINDGRMISFEKCRHAVAEMLMLTQSLEKFINEYSDTMSSALIAHLNHLPLHQDSSISDMPIIPSVNASSIQTLSN